MSCFIDVHSFDVSFSIGKKKLGFVDQAFDHYRVRGGGGANIPALVLFSPSSCAVFSQLIILLRLINY